jgi:hypothetical protein
MLIDTDKIQRVPNEYIRSNNLVLSQRSQLLVYEYLDIVKTSESNRVILKTSKLRNLCGFNSKTSASSIMSLFKKELQRQFEFTMDGELNSFAGVFQYMKYRSIENDFMFEMNMDLIPLYQLVKTNYSTIEYKIFKEFKHRYTGRLFEEATTAFLIGKNKKYRTTGRVVRTFDEINVLMGTNLQNKYIPRKILEKVKLDINRAYQKYNDNQKKQFCYRYYKDEGVTKVEFWLEKVPFLKTIKTK